MAEKIYRINYKSDFVLRLQCDAGWGVPFCIKFWTRGNVQQAFYVSYDGETYTNCYMGDTPDVLVVTFDDHQMGVGELFMQVGYHLTAADFPTGVEDEVLNQQQVKVLDPDTGEECAVLLDFQGDTAPDIQYSLPAYEAEKEREERFAQMMEEAEEVVGNVEKTIKDAVDKEAEARDEADQALDLKIPFNVSADSSNLVLRNKNGTELFVIKAASRSGAGAMSVLDKIATDRLNENIVFLGLYSNSGAAEAAAATYAGNRKTLMMYYFTADSFEAGAPCSVGVIRQYVVNTDGPDTDQWLNWNGMLFYRRVTSSGASAWLRMATPSYESWEEVASKARGAADGITHINELIPSGASSQNQLADKDFVNSSVSTNTAYYISNNGQPFASVAELEAYSGTITNNDYAFVVGADAAGNTTYTRYKYNANTQQWAAEYVLNNSSFTAAQWATINSGIVSEDVRRLRDLPYAADIPVAGQMGIGGFEFRDKGDNVLFILPFAGSDSGGLISLDNLNRFMALGTKQELDEMFDTKQDKLPLVRGAGEDSMCTDSTNEASGKKSIALGDGNVATHLGAMAFGKNNGARQEFAYCFGENNSTIGWDSFLAGTGNSVRRHMGMAFGRQNTVYSWAGIAVGLGLVTYDNQENDDNNGEVAFGRYNVSASGQVFSVGCGTSDNDRRNAIAVDKNGKVSFPQENTSVTYLATASKKIPTDVSRSATDATFVHVENGVTTNLFHLRQATTSMAGLMTAADRTKLNNLPDNAALAELTQQITALSTRVTALEGMLNEVNNALEQL